jgi:hypothetical protein
MALSPITPIPVNWENSLVDLQPTSQFGAAHDTAMVNTTMLLQAAAEEDVTFALPMADEPEGEPVMRVVADELGDVQEFTETTDFGAIEAEFGEELTKDENAKGLVDAAKAEAKQVRNHQGQGQEGRPAGALLLPAAGAQAGGRHVSVSDPGALGVVRAQPKRGRHFVRSGASAGAWQDGQPGLGHLREPARHARRGADREAHPGPAAVRSALP